MVELHGFDIIVGHTTYVATTIERTDIGAIVTVCGSVLVVLFTVEVHTRDNVQGAALHVFIKNILGFQVQGTEIHCIAAICWCYVAMILC